MAGMWFQLETPCSLIPRWARSMNGSPELAPPLRQRICPCVTPYPSVTGPGLMANDQRQRRNSSCQQTAILPRKGSSEQLPAAQQQLGEGCASQQSGARSAHYTQLSATTPRREGRQHSEASASSETLVP